MSSPDSERLPLHWPSAWPSMWPALRDRLVVVALTSGLVVAGLARFGDLGLSWWVALVPFVALVGPLTRPVRFRRAIQRAAVRRTLNVQYSTDGLCVSVPRRHITARVAGDGGVTYGVRCLGERRKGAPSWR